MHVNASVYILGSCPSDQPRQTNTNIDTAAKQIATRKVVDNTTDRMGAELINEKTGAVHEEYQGRTSSTGDRRRSSFDQANLSMVLPDKTHLAETAFDDSIEDLPTSWFVWLVAATASIAGSLFGYDTGIISAVLVYLNNDLNNRPVSSSEKELITSLCSGGAFIGAIIAGLTADQYGRKLAIYVGCFLFTVGAIIQGSSYSIAQMAVGRLVVGFGVGSAAMVVPLYIGKDLFRSHPVLSLMIT